MVGSFLGRLRRKDTKLSSEEELGELGSLVQRPVQCVVLARGGGGRVEGDQAFMDVGGVPMAERVVSTLAEVGDVLVVGRPGTLAGRAAVPHYRRDSRSGLTGLVTGMQAAKDLAPPGVSPLVVLVGVDQPYVRPETLRFLLAFASGYEAIVPVDDGELQPTCAVYPLKMLPEARRIDREDGTLEDLLAATGAVQVPAARWRAWGEDGRSWFRVDGAESISEAESRFG